MTPFLTSLDYSTGCFEDNGPTQGRRFAPARRPASSWLSALALSALVLVSGAAQAQKTAPSPGEPNTNPAVLFEVDADFVANSIPTWWSTYGYDNSTPAKTITKGADWSSVLSPLSPSAGLDNTKSTVWYVDGNSGNKATKVEGDIFAGTSNKNGDPIGKTQQPYSIANKAGGPQKNDITNVYFHKDVFAGQTWLFFGAETRSTDGTSYLDFEYNQAGVVIEDGKLYGPKAPGAAVVNGRAVGDFIVVVNFSGGGAKPSVGTRTWLSSGQWSAETTAGLGTTAYLVTNVQNVPAITPTGGFTGDGAASNTSLAFQFVEGGLDITNILPSATCSPLATMTVKTRSSDSFTAELKDLALLNYPLNPPPTLKTKGLSACAGSKVDLHAGVTESTGVLAFYTDADRKNLVPDATQAPVGNPAITYYVKTVDATTKCENYATIAALENPAPTLKTQGLSACASFTVNLTAGVTESTGTLAFYTDAARTIAVADPTKAPVGNPAITYYVRATSDKGCITDATIAASEKAKPDAPAVEIEEPSLCGNATATLIVKTSLTGAEYNLYTKAGVFVEKKTGDGKDLRFEKLAPGSGFSITVTTVDGCISDPATCPTSLTGRSAATQDASAMPMQRSIQTEAYPNPTGQDATINFSVPKSGRVVVELYNSLGAKVATIFDGEVKADEQRSATLKGALLQSGTYTYRVIANGSTKSNRISLVK